MTPGELAEIQAWLAEVRLYFTVERTVKMIPTQARPMTTSNLAPKQFSVHEALTIVQDRLQNMEQILRAADTKLGDNGPSGSNPTPTDNQTVLGQLTNILAHLSDLQEMAGRIGAKVHGQ